MRFMDREEVARRLTYELCIPIVREAMIAFSKGETKQLLRSIITLSDGRFFGVMPGAMGSHAAFGAKLISVFHENFAKGIQSHQGLIVLFDPGSGAPVGVVHAGEVTAIRTAAASAVATDALARKDARRLTLLGYGEQAGTHARAISRVRNLESIVIWGRSPERAQAFAKNLQAELALPVSTAPDVRAAVATADIVCTVTAATEPILKGEWVRPGTHLNVVGSGFPGPTEVDNDLVVRSRFIADSREGVLHQGAEFLHAKAAGLIGDDHIVAEIGQVLAGDLPGRRSAEEITVYKSLGHVVQDLASAWAIYSQAESESKLREFATRYTAAWCSQNPASVAAHYAPNGSLTINSGAPAVGRDAITASAQGFMSSFPDLQVLFDNLLTKGDRAEYHWTLVGTNTGPGGTGRKVRISGYEVWKIGSDGLIAESQGHFDSADYEYQLQHDPKHS